VLLYIFFLLIYRVFLNTKSWMKMLNQQLWKVVEEGKKSNAVYCILTSYLLDRMDM